MKKYLDQLKPQERRWVVGIGVVLFLMLNYFFVWPHFKDWNRDTARLDIARETIEKYQKKIQHQSEYKRKIAEFASGGSSVLPEDQAIDFERFYRSRANTNRVVVVNTGGLATRTNEFSLEQVMGITVLARETNLVDFLYSLSEGNSMMRVRNMSLRPDPSHLQISAALTLVASYGRKPAATTSPARKAGGQPAPAAAPAPAKRAAKPAPPVSAATLGLKPATGNTNRAMSAQPRSIATNKSGIFPGKNR